MWKFRKENKIEEVNRTLYNPIILCYTILIVTFRFQQERVCLDTRPNQCPSSL